MLTMCLLSHLFICWVECIRLNFHSMSTSLAACSVENSLKLDFPIGSRWKSLRLMGMAYFEWISIKYSLRNNQMVGCLFESSPMKLIWSFLLYDVFPTELSIFIQIVLFIQFQCSDHSSAPVDLRGESAGNVSLISIELIRLQHIQHAHIPQLTHHTKRAHAHWSVGCSENIVRI